MNRSRLDRLRLVSVALTLVLSFGCGGESQPAPRAVILMIGDGMGISQITLARDYLHRGQGRLALESFPAVGLVSTHSASNLVTDSAASGTAMAAGVKIANKAIGLTPSGARPQTLLTLAQTQGWRTGLVTNTEITHATPASFYGHVDNRYLQENVDRLAEQLVERAPDVVMGGGLADFLPFAEGGARLDGKRVLDTALAAGYTVWDASTGLADERPQKLLALLADGHLNYELDRFHLPDPVETPPLGELVDVALEILDRDHRPYFLMIEGGRIDHAGHAFDAPGVVAEMEAFDRVIAQVMAYQEANPDVLVLLTADHATGGLAINDFVEWDRLAEQRASVDYMTAAIRSDDGPPTVAELAQLAGAEVLTQDDVDTVRVMSDKYDAARTVGTRLSERLGVTWLPRVDGMETGGHTGEDVAIFALGPGAERFTGMLDNTDIPLRLQQLLGWPELNPDL